MVEGEDKIKNLYKALVSDPDKEVSDKIKKYGIKSFKEKLMSDENAAGELAGYALKKKIVKDDTEFYTLIGALRPQDAPTKAQPAPQPSQPPAVSLAPPQRQSIEQQAAGQATGFVPPMQAMPMQATGQPQTGQIIELTGEPQTGEFRAEIVNGKKVYMPQGITAGGEEFIDEGTDVSKDPTGQYQSTGVLIDDRGQTLNEELQNIVTGTPKDKQGLAYQNAQNVKNDAKSTWQRLKETGSGLLTSAKTQADAAMGFLDTVLNPMSFIPGASKPVSQGGFGGETNLAKGAKKEFIRTALDGEKELNNKIQELGLQTDIVDAVKSGRGSDIIQAINHNIGQMAYQVPLSISTFGASSFAMEGAEAYKGIVDAQAKELGITADELIERGLDKQALGIGVGAISGAVDYLGAKSLASFINAGGAYEQLAKAIASKLPKKYGTGFLTRAAVASNAEGFQESIQEGVKLGGERIASGKWDPNALNRLGKSYANAAVGAGGTYVGGRTVNAALNPSESITLNTFNNAPVIGQAPQQGGFDAVILADQINQGKKVDIQSALAADAYLDSEIQRQGENVSPELLEHKKTISEFIDKENEFAPRRQARKDVLPDGSVLYFVGSEAEVPEEFKDRAKPSTSTRDGKPVGSFSFTLTPEEDAAYQQGVPPSGADQTTYETVTPEELQAFQTDPNFATNNPERAAAIADDVALIQSGQMDINSIDDPNYRLMVESAMAPAITQEGAGVDGGGVVGTPTGMAQSPAVLYDEKTADSWLSNALQNFEEKDVRLSKLDELEQIVIADQRLNPQDLEASLKAINKERDILQSNATPQSETIVADQAAQNMGTAVNQPLETGAAAVEVGESGRPVVEVEGDQVVEEEKPTQQIAATEMALEDLIAESESFDEKIKAEKERLDRIAPNRQIIGGADIDNLSPEDAARYVELNDEIGRRQGTSQEAAKQRVAEKREQRKAETKTQQITDLRAKEQAEYDAMSDPSDQKKRDEIYDRYNKLISPLLPSQKNVKSSEKAEAPKAGSVGVGGDVEDYKGIFNPKKTGISGLDALLKDDGYNYFYKGVSGEVVMMSPDEYLKRVREGLKTKEDANIIEDKKDAINEAINEGNKIDMPFISTKDGKFSQEGRNRAVVARERGEKLIPVFIEKDVSFDDKIAKGQEYINSAIKDGATTKEEVLSKLKEQGLHRDGIRFIDDNFNDKAVEQSLKEAPKPKAEKTTTITETTPKKEKKAQEPETPLSKSADKMKLDNKDRVVGEGATILPSVDADKADAQLYILQRNNYYTLWYNRKQVDEKTGETLWSYSNYLTILSQDLDNARTKALDYLNKIASGEFLSTAFVGKNTQGLEDVKTIALQEGVLTPETQSIYKSKTPGVEKNFGIGKYSSLTIDELLDKDPSYAQWFVNNYTSRGADQTKAIIKGDPRYQDYLNIKRDIEELEKARVEAYEAREAERKTGKAVPVATLVRGEEGDIKEVIEETTVAKKQVQKQERRIVKNQITDIIPPQSKAPDKVAPLLKPQMFDAQVDGANTAIASMDKYGVVLNGDGAGVGKTRQIIAVAKHYADSGKPVVIISENAALGKPFEGGKKPTLGGSMAKDSEAMGVTLTLLTDNEQVQPGGIYVSTYNRVKEGDVPAGAIIIFDESHNLVNTFGRTPDSQEVEEERQWEAKFRPMLKKAGAVAYYSATPADKPHQLAYLYKTLGFNTPEDFLSEMMANGAVIKERKFGKTKIKYYDVPNSKARKADLYKWVNGLMVKAGKEGRFIKREISYEGTDVQFHDIKGTDESKNQYAKEFNKVLDDMSDAEQMDYWLLAPNSYILYAAELAKIGDAVNIIKKQRAQGRKSIIFVSRINPMEIRGRKQQFDGELGDPEVLGEIPSPVPMLEEALRKEGIKFVGLHSKAKTTSQKAQKQFAEEADVLIASLESGGTGINLDDTVGDNPRTEVFLFSPYRGISTIQGMGRIWRASTIQNDNNPNRYVFVTASDISPDLKRSGVLAKKLQLMNAAIGGTAVSKLPMSKVSYSSEELVGIELPDDTDEESAIFKEKTGILKPVNIDWKQSRKGGYYADASADLLEWMERGGPDRTGLDVRVFKSEDGKWVALAGKDYKADEFAPEGIIDESDPQAISEKTSPLTPFQTKGEEGQAARAALKESVGPKEFKRLENIAKNGEKILRDLESRQILKIDCP